MTYYPSIAAGTDITDDLLNSMMPAFVLKPSDTSRTSTTTFTADPDLTFSLAANATYEIVLYLHYSGHQSGLIKTQWTVPSGATGLRSGIGAASTNTDANLQGDGRFAVHGFTTAVTYGTRTTSTFQCAAIEEGIVTTTNAGTFSLDWAQNASHATATTVHSNSRLWVRRLA